MAEADPSGVTVYNFTVANDHTYFVDQGGNAVWVHNACRTPQELVDALQKDGINARIPNVGNVTLRPGRVLTDIDILTDEYGIEFKGGQSFRRNQLSSQMRMMNLVCSKEVVLYGESIPDAMIKYVNARGFKAFNTYEDLLAFLKN